MVLPVVVVELSAVVVDDSLEAAPQLNTTKEHTVITLIAASEDTLNKRYFCLSKKNIPHRNKKINADTDVVAVVRKLKFEKRLGLGCVTSSKENE